MSYDSKNVTNNSFSPPQHRLHNPNEPLPGSERGRALDDAGRSLHSSSEGQFSSSQPSATETNVRVASNDLACEQKAHGVVSDIGSTSPVRGGRRAPDDADRSPHVSSVSSEGRSSSNLPSATETNVRAASDDPACEQKAYGVVSDTGNASPVRGGRRALDDADYSPHVSSVSSEGRSLSSLPSATETNVHATSDDPACEHKARGVVSDVGNASPVRGGGRALDDADRSPLVSYASSEGRTSSSLPSVTEASVHPVNDGPESRRRGRGGQAPAFGSAEPGMATFGRTAFNTERSLGVAPVPEGQYISRQVASKVINGAMLYYAGGVAIGGQSELPVGHAGLGDKLIGKAEKVRISLCGVFIRLICPQMVGKYTSNPERREKGELREAGGKAAVEGRARAAYD